MLFRLRFIHWVMVSPFILPCFPFLFHWWMKRWEIDELYGLYYYIMQMAKYTWAWLHHPLELLTSEMFCLVLIQVNQDGFMFRLICMFLGCDLTIQLILKSSTYDDRLVDHFHYISVRCYEICNILYLNKLTYMLFYLHVLYQYNCFFVYTLLLTSSWWKAA